MTEQKPQKWKKSSFDIAMSLWDKVSDLMMAEGDEAIDRAQRELDKEVELADDKFLALRFVRSRMKMEIDSLKSEENAFKQRRLSREKALERIEGTALMLMEARFTVTQETEAKTSDGSWIRYYPANLKQEVVIKSQDKLPEEFIKKSVDKAALRSALKAGESVDGAHLETYESPVIRWGK